MSGVCVVAAGEVLCGKEVDVEEEMGEMGSFGWSGIVGRVVRLVMVGGSGLGATGNG